jgi:hypothetical protein
MEPWNLEGQRFGRLVAQEASQRKGRSAWWCLCDCGKRTLVQTSTLKAGRCKSCGCYRVDKGKQRGADSRKHGHCTDGNSPEYQAWSLAKQRCTNPKAPNWKRYGGRGISMCPRWLASFDTFLADMGSRPSPDHSIDRKDNDRGYECGACPTCREKGLAETNCRWATSVEQNNNHSRTIYVTRNGVRKPLMVWARELGMPHQILRSRITRGWDVEEAIAAPYAPGHKYFRPKA